MDVSPDKRLVRPQTVLIIGAVVLVAALAGIYWFVQKRQAALPDSDLSLTTAPEGQLAQGFPPDLILEKDAELQKSYRVDSKGVSQPAATYVSSRTLAENIAAFRDYFDKNGWALTHEATVEEGSGTFFYAEKDSHAASVTFVEENGSLFVMIATL